MGLTRYKEKRDFSKSPEPQGGKPNKDKLLFVVQKHAASHLHYDFRLEVDGVLKSWAVPKGPSMDPSIKRLAMMVEDHPFDYRTFEGIIPSGYGAGTVMVWDEGSFEAADGTAHEKKAQYRSLRSQILAGKIKFILHGKKLRGEFALVKAPARGDNAWLLMKLEDEYASDKDITKKDKSAVTGRTLEQIAGSSDSIWESHKPARKSARKATAKAAPKKTAKRAVKKKSRRRLSS
jgi:bifunctional non-homologous end joining protein LigD